MNIYEKDNPLQVKWRKASKVMMCLCTMRESCYHCDGDSTKKRRDAMNAVIVEAREQGYQLWSEPQQFLGEYFKPTPIKMVQQTTSGFELD